MKKTKLWLCLLLCLFVAVFVAGCSAQEGGDRAQSKESNAQEVQEKTDGVDVDLSALSATMVYAEVFNMMTTPELYLGKTIKATGTYFASFYEETGLYYHYVVIKDVAACCQQGLEFIREGETQYPEDYPEDETEIAVTGVFASYEELGETYYYLADAVMVVKE